MGKKRNIRNGSLGNPVTDIVHLDGYDSRSTCE